MGDERVSGRAGKVTAGVAEYISVVRSDGRLDPVDDRDFIEATIGTDTANLLLDAYSLSRHPMGGCDSVVIKEFSIEYGIGFLPLMRAINMIEGSIDVKDK